MAARIYPLVEMEFSGEGSGWTDVTGDVHGPTGLTARRGLPGSDPTDRVARTGTADFALLNNAENSGGLEGYYSPGHANVRSGFDVGIGVRVSVRVVESLFVEDGFVEDDFVEEINDTVFWTGTISKIEPEPGQYGLPRVTHIEAVDYIDVLARSSLSDCDVEQGIAEGEAIAAVLAKVNKQPRASSIGTGEDTYDYFFDLVTEEDGSALREFQRICQSSYGTLYVDPDGGLVYEPRNEKRAVDGSPLTVTVDILESDLQADRPPQIADQTLEVINSINVVLTPREKGSSTEVIARHTDPQTAFPPGESIIYLPYTDADERGLRVGAIDIQAMASGTDYAFNSIWDGSGTDETSNVTVTASASGNRVKLTLNNTQSYSVFPVTTGGTVLLQVQGTRIASKEDIYLSAEDSASITKLGEHKLSVAMPYQGSITVAQAFADWFRDTLATENRKVQEVPLLLNPSDTDRARALLALEVSDIVTLTETQTALDNADKYWVQSLELDAEGPGSGERIMLNLELAPAYAGPFIEFPAEQTYRHLGTFAENNQDKTTFVSGSFPAPTANRLLLLTCNYGRSDSGTPSPPSSITGMGLTWVKIDHQDILTGAVHNQGIALYRAMGSSPSAGALTVTFAANYARCTLLLDEIGDLNTGGSNGSGAIVQSAKNSGVTPVTATLAAFTDAENRPYICAGGVGAALLTPESGYTLMGRVQGTSPAVSAWHTSSADTSPSIASLGSVGAIAVELDMTP